MPDSVRPMQELRAGDRLGRYELVCILTQGGMGAIWLARMEGQHGFERLVALKTILPLYSQEERFRAMFLDEARIASRIDHPNVVSIIDVGEQNGHLYFAMEYIEGESLKRLYKSTTESDGGFPIAIALRLVADAAAGIHAAHELTDESGAPLEVVHRDISPQNLLVTPRGVVKVIDFGVARARDRLTQATESGTLKGKVNYMAPEQAKGGATDRRADVYALGACLYFLLMGRAPYESEESTQLTVLHKLLLGEPMDAPDSRLPIKVRHVLERALASDPNARFPTADALRLAIEDAIHPHRTSTLDVASLFERHLNDRIRERRAAIQEAVLESKKRVKPIVPAPSESAPSMTAGGTSLDEVPTHAPKKKPYLLVATMSLVSLLALGVGVRLGARTATTAPPHAETLPAQVVEKAIEEPKSTEPPKVDPATVPAEAGSATAHASTPKSSVPKKAPKKKSQRVDDGF